MSRNPKSKEVTKRAVLAELERLRQGRHARYQTLVGRFARCSEQQSVAAAVCRRSRGQRAHLQPHAPRRTARLASSGQLMAQGSGLVLPRFGTVPVVHRLVADDRLAVMLAMALVDTGYCRPWRLEKGGPRPNIFYQNYA